MKKISFEEIKTKYDFEINFYRFINLFNQKKENIKAFKNNKNCYFVKVKNKIIIHRRINLSFFLNSRLGIPLNSLEMKISLQNITTEEEHQINLILALLQNESPYSSGS